MYKLEYHLWGNSEDSDDNGVYFSLSHDNKQLEETTWVSSSELFHDPSTKNELKKEVINMCNKYNLLVETKPEYFGDWKLINV